MAQGKLFDGFDVSAFAGKFAGNFDLEEDMAENLRFDDSVTFIVTGRINGVDVRETKIGDLKRINVFQITSSTALEPEVASKVLNTLSQSSNSPQLPLHTDDPDIDEQLAAIGPQPTQNGIQDDGPEQVGGIPIKDPVLAEFLKEE